MDITVNSRWTTDCQGKQDLDFDIVNAYTRYWPDYSAQCQLVFLNNFCSGAKRGEDPYVESSFKPFVLAASDIMYGSSEADIKKIVRRWYNEHIIEAMEKSLELIKTAK